MAKCVPVTGDGHFLPLRWQEQGQDIPAAPLRDSLDAVRNQPLRLFLELEQARLFAVRVEADLVYGFVPETSLAGDYIPDRCY